MPWLSIQLFRCENLYGTKLWSLLLPPMLEGFKFSLYQILDLDEPGQEMFAYMKKCCKVLDDQKIAWNHDGKNGDENLNNLDNIVIKSLTTEGNYSRLHNGKKGTGGSRKKDVCNQIADMINHSGKRKMCTGTQVQSKIEQLEKSF